MRYPMIIALACGAALCGCNGRPGSKQNLRDSIAALKDSIAIMKAEIPSARPADKNNLDMWVGGYGITDDRGRTWEIELRDDKTAVAVCGETGRTFYGSWRLESSLDYQPDIAFSEPYPDIAFIHYSQNHCQSLYFRDAYVYPTYTTAMAKNQDNRLDLSGILYDDE